jgi:hypothetical protein
VVFRGRLLVGGVVNAGKKLPISKALPVDERGHGTDCVEIVHQGLVQIVKPKT